MATLECRMCKQLFEMPKIIAPGSGAAGAIGGGAFGLHVGVAAFGTAITGMLPLAVAGAGLFFVPRAVRCCWTCLKQKAGVRA